MSDLKTRLISGAFGLITLILIVSWGGIALNLSVLLLSIIGIYEYSKSLKKLNLNVLNILAYVYLIIMYLIGDSNSGLLLLLLVYILLLSLLIGRYSLEDIAVTLIGIIYIGGMLSYIPRLSGNLNIWLIFIIAFGTDTFAYFGGNIFGKNKLCPKISPNKTIEGFISGILGSLILTVLFALKFNPNRIYLYIPLSILAAILSQAGDLVASSIKRYTGIKDYGKLIPGHGGVLDRFDSIIFISPVVYYYITMFIK